MAAPKQSVSLAKCINGLRYRGVGAKITRDIFHFPDSYWIVTKVKLSTDGDHGKAYGTMVWRGIRKNNIEKIGGYNKKQWILLDTPDYRKFNGTRESLHELLQSHGISRSDFDSEMLKLHMLQHTNSDQILDLDSKEAEDQFDEQAEQRKHSELNGENNEIIELNDETDEEESEGEGEVGSTEKAGESKI